MAISAEDRDFLVSLYVGYFNRAPDPAGLQFWIDQVEAGRDTNTIAADFAASPEAKSLYPFLTTPDVSSPTSFITAVYANLFNRAPDAAGQAFWEQQLSSGAVSPADAIDAIIKGATTAPDSTILANKNTVGLDFATDAGNTPGFTFDLNGASGNAATSAISGVTEDASTVIAAQAATDAYLNGVAGVGETLTLTTGVDDLSGTASNDTFTGLIASADATLNALDEVDGGSGTDSLTLNLTDSYNGEVADATFSSVETFNVRSSEALAAFDVSGVSDLTTLNITDADSLGTTAATTTAVNVSGVSGAITVDGGSNVVVTDSNADANITVGDTTESAGTVSVTDTAQGTGVITVEGGTDATVTATVTASTADVAGGDINVGNNTDQPTGAISVTQNNVNPGAQNSAGTPAVLAFDLAGLVLDTNDTLQFANAGTVFTATGDNTAASAVATAIDGTTVTVNGVTYDAAATGTTITYTAQTNTSNNVSTDFGALSSTDNAPSGGTYSAPTSTIPTTDTDGTAPGVVDLTAGAINVQGGTTIDVDVNSTSTAAAETSNGDITNGTVTATAGDNTTSISVVQDLAATTNTKAATDLVGGTSTVTFKALASGETVTVAGLTFEAAKDLTAEEVASAFADLTAVDTQSNGTVSNGVYTNDVDANITSGAVSGSSVVFTNTGGAAAPTLGLASSAGATSLPTSVNATGTAAVAAVTSTNTVTAGAVTANDNATASVTDITLSSFGTATLGTTNGFDALVNLSLTDSNGATTLDTAATTLTMNVDDVTDNVTIDSGAATVETLTINTSGGASDFDLTAAAVTDLTVSGDANLTLTGSTLSALETATISGAGAVNLDDVSATIETLAAGTATGVITATVDGTKAAVTTGDGADVITINTAGLSKAVDLGAGDDTLILTGAATTPTATIDGGAGTNTLSLTDATAAARGGDTNFGSAFTNFSTLSVGAGASTLDVKNLGFASSVILAGAHTGTLNNLASGGTVELKVTGNDATLNVEDAATNASDSLNLVANVAGTNVDFGDATIANVQTISLTANDTLEDDNSNGTVTTGEKPVETATLELNAANATTLNINGSANVTLDDSSVLTALTTVNAGSLTGALDFEVQTNGVTVTGGSGADKIEIDADSVTVNAGAGNDVITIVDNADLVQINGGEGADTFDFDGTSTNDSNFTVINGIGSGDKIDLAGLTGGVSTFKSTAITLSPGATETTQAFLDQAMVNLAAGEAGWFTSGGNTFIAVDVDSESATSFTDDEDFVVMLTGVIDLSTGATFNSTSDTLEIV
ncbi:DUF4214 domain-containing protein [Tritonibacter mobilis]